jgi:hypothetical protein
MRFGSWSLARPTRSTTASTIRSTRVCRHAGGSLGRSSPAVFWTA